MPTMTSDDKSTPRPELPDADRDWFGGRRWTGILAIGVVILVVLCVLVLLLVHRNNSSDGTPSPPPQTAPVSSPMTKPAGALPTAIPTAAPSGTTWSLYETVALPAIAGQGPAHVDGAIATGYAHTPAGALLAIVNEGLRYQLAPDSQWKAAAAQMLDPSVAGYQAWLKVRAANPYGSQGAVAGDQLAQIAAFQFVSYTPGDAVVQIVTRATDGTYQVASDHVTWRGTDWKYVVAADGGQAANIQQIDDLSGFVEWRGV